MTVPTNSKVILRDLLMREKQISTSVMIEIQKENWGKHAFFEDN